MAYREQYVTKREKEMTNGWTAKCEECGKLIGDLAYERKGKLLCRRCAYKQDGKHIEKSGDD